MYFFLAQDPLATWGRRIRSPGLLDGHNMILGHYRLVRHCDWSSGGALATLGRRRRPPQARPQREEERSGAEHPGSGSGSGNSLHHGCQTRFTSLSFPPPRREVMSCRRRLRAREVARAAPDDQTQCITRPLCLGIMWGDQRVAYGAHGSPTGPVPKKT